MRTRKRLRNDNLTVKLSTARHAQGLFFLLIPALFFGCITAKPPAPVRMASGQKTPPPKPQRVLQAWEQPLQNLDKKVDQLDKSSREVMADIQRQLATQEESLRLLQGNLEVVQHENKGIKEWMTLLGEPVGNAIKTQAGFPEQGLGVQDSQPGADLPSQLGGNALPFQPSAKETPQQLYDGAFLLLKGGQYDAARKGFSRFIEKFPNDTLSDNAQYWIGELYSVQKQYREALVAFNQVLVHWPDSPKVPPSLLKMGFAFYELGDMASAHTSLMRLVTDYPSSPAVAMARRRLRDIANKQDIADKIGIGNLGQETNKVEPMQDVENDSRRVKRINRVMGN